MTNIYCSMIHGGLHLNMKSDHIMTQSCCLRPELISTSNDKIWNSDNFKSLRTLNQSNTWDSKCKNCQSLENSGFESMRTGMNNGLQIYGQTNLAGPARIDLMFDVSCNLACRTCGPTDSTFWQKHLKENSKWPGKISTPSSNIKVIEALKTLDLSNLRMLVFCGGETLLGKAYWDIAEWLADNVPNAKQQLTISFQTNGTQPIHHSNYRIIEKLHLVKLHISLDGVGKRFNYIRWPANWDKTTANILSIRDTAPSNMMFLIEETISIFNLAYLEELDLWVKNNFTTNREGDIINHTRHLAFGLYSIDNLTEEYVKYIKQGPYKNLIPNDWKENSVKINQMLTGIAKFDSYRNESFTDTFPEVASFYSKFISDR